MGRKIVSIIMPQLCWPIQSLIEELVIVLYGCNIADNLKLSNIVIANHIGS